MATACVVTQGGCARSEGHAARNQSDVSKRMLSPENAAVLAAKLANEECKHRYRREPFQPELHTAVLQDGFYRWGQLDVGGVAGFSAMVYFRQDGSERHVEVYFSSDTLGLR
jgi:hypothetical protein